MSVRAANKEKKTGKHGRRLAVSLFLFFAGILVLSACDKSEKGPEEELPSVQQDRLYFINEEETKLVSEEYRMKGQTREEQVVELLAALTVEPQTEGCRRALPEGVSILSYSIGTNNVLTLQFDTTYQQVTGVTEVLMRAAIVKMLCQAEEISSVEFYVGGQPLMRAGGKPVGMMKAEDFIESTGADAGDFQMFDVSVYYANQEGTALLEARLTVSYDGANPIEKVVIGQLLGAPPQEGMYPALPEGTILNKISVKDGTCTVDFNEKFMEKRSGVSEEVTIYAVVNSLTALPAIQRVQFTINGETKKTYQNMDFSVQFERNLEIVEGEQ